MTSAIIIRELVPELTPGAADMAYSPCACQGCAHCGCHGCCRLVDHPADLCSPCYGEVS